MEGKLSSFYARFGKSIFDYVITPIIIFFLSPLMILIAILIKASSRGPVLFRQKRVGLHNRLFVMYKFRSMYVDAPAYSEKPESSDDPRITPVGRWLRKFSLDELPQLFNVLKGDMSFVGPRPERKKFVEQFIHQIPLYSRRLNVKPGLTGWAQIKYKYDESIEDVKVKLSYDIFYLDNISLRFDLKILLQTVAVMLRGKGQ
jgi:exopolysaccharide biosynthesis polyprenyl glycosylphosphotransferase